MSVRFLDNIHATNNIIGNTDILPQVLTSKLSAAKLSYWNVNQYEDLQLAAQRWDETTSATRNLTAVNQTILDIPERADEWDMAYEFAVSANNIPIFYSAIIGDDLSNQFSISHSLSTQEVMVQCFNTSSGNQVHPSVHRVSNSEISLNFNKAPALSSVNVLVMAVKSKTPAILLPAIITGNQSPTTPPTPDRVLVFNIDQNFSFSKTHEYSVLNIANSNLLTDLYGVLYADQDLELENGTSIELINSGEGNVIITTQLGVELNSLNSKTKIMPRGGVARLRKLGPNKWNLSGDLTV